MTATLISLISITAGILGANFAGTIFKNDTFDLVGNTIAGVFGGVLFIKVFGRLGCDPMSILQTGYVNWLLFFLNLITSFSGGVLAVVIVKRAQKRLGLNRINKK